MALLSGVVPEIDWRKFDFGLVPEFAFLSLVVLFSLLAWLLLSRRIRIWRKERLARLKKHDAFAAVPTASPYENLEEKARRAAENNVNARFSVMRGVLTGSLLITGGTVVLLPFLGELPQTLLSLLMAVVVAIVGIAARPLIENFISGIVLSFSKQLKVGDTVLLDAEHYGTVEDINPTHTVLKLWDWRRYVVPNSTMLQKEVISYSHKDNFLWTHVAFHVAPGADLDEVERLACAAAAESPYMADFEEPQFWLREMLAESSLCWVAAWARTPEDAWYLRAWIRRALTKRLREAGIPTHVAFCDVELRPGSASVLPEL